MKLIVTKRITYSVMGVIITGVLVFNPLMLDWWDSLNAPTRIQGVGAAGASSEVKAMRQPQQPEQYVNYYSSVLVPVTLYYSKKLGDLFFAWAEKKLGLRSGN